MKVPEITEAHSGFAAVILSTILTMSCQLAAAQPSLSKAVCDDKGTPSSPRAAVEDWMSKTLGQKISWESTLSFSQIDQVDLAALDRMGTNPVNLQRLFAEVKADLGQAIQREPHISDADKSIMQAEINYVEFKMASDLAKEGLLNKTHYIASCSYAGTDINASVSYATAGTQPLVFICPGTIAWGAIIGLTKFESLFRRTMAHELGHFIAASHYERDSKFAGLYDRFLSCIGEKLGIKQFDRPMKSEYTADYWGSAASAVYFERVAADPELVKKFSIASFSPHKGKKCSAEKSDNSAYASSSQRINILWGNSPGLYRIFRNNDSTEPCGI